MELNIRERLDSQLPATPCTPNMRKQIEDLAVKLGVSKAEVQRLAFGFFLSKIATDTINNDSSTIKEKLAS